MNIPIWLLLIAPPVFAMIGFFACAVLAVGKAVDAGESADTLERIEENLLAQIKDKQKWITRAQGAEKAHTRVTDALAAKNDRIDRALACVTENSAHVGKKMAAILKGER